MLTSFMIAKVAYTKQQENGAFKRVTEPYLLAAMTFTDAESRIYEELGSIIRGEFVVKAIAREELDDIFHYEDSETWYKCKVATQDPESDKNKVTHNFYYISAGSVKEATERLIESLRDMVSDYEIKAVVESPVVEVFPYKEDLDRELSRSIPQEFVDLDNRFEKRLKILTDLGYVKDESDDNTWYENAKTNTSIDFEQVYEVDDEIFEDLIK